MKQIFRRDVDPKFPPAEYRFDADDVIEITRTVGGQTQKFRATVGEAITDRHLTTSRGSVQVSAVSVERPDVQVLPGATQINEVVGRPAGDERWDGESVVDFRSQVPNDS